MAVKTIVALPGEAIAPEVVEATCELLMATGLPLKILTPPQGSPLPEETKRAAREDDGVLLGAAGPSTALLRENSEGLYPGREGDLAEMIKLMPNLDDRTGRTIKDFGTEGRFAVKVV